MLLIVAIIWATGFIATKIAIDTGMSVYDILLIRFILSKLSIKCYIKSKTNKLKGNDKIRIDISIFPFYGIFNTNFRYKMHHSSKECLINGNYYIYHIYHFFI